LRDTEKEREGERVPNRKRWCVRGRKMKRETERGRESDGVECV